MATLQEVLAMRETLTKQRDAARAQYEAATANLNATLAKVDEALMAAYYKSARLDDIIAAYVSTRDEKEALVERQKAEVAEFNQRLQDIERWCLGHLNRIGAESVKAATGTVYSKNRVSTTVSDAGEFFEWVRENDAFDMIEARCSKSAIEAHLSSTGELPPGINRRVEKIIGVNRPSVKH